MNLAKRKARAKRKAAYGVEVLDYGRRFSGRARARARGCQSDAGGGELKAPRNIFGLV